MRSIAQRRNLSKPSQSSCLIIAPFAKCCRNRLFGHPAAVFIIHLFWSFEHLNFGFASYSCPPSFWRIVLGISNLHILYLPSSLVCRPSYVHIQSLSIYANLRQSVKPVVPCRSFLPFASSTICLHTLLHTCSSENLTGTGSGHSKSIHTSCE
jgi:hypothetical protein